MLIYYMKLIRAILSGVLLWILIFFEVSILMFGFGLDQTTMNYYVAHYILEILLVVLVSLIYFRRARAGALRGLFLGIIFIIVGIILDAVLTIPLFMDFDYGFIVSGGLLISYVMALIVTSIVGWLKK